MMRFAPFFLAAALLPGCLAPGDHHQPTGSTAELPDARHVAATYRSLRSMTPDPVLVDPGLAMLCRGATLSDVQKARRTAGPHAHTAVSIYMNDLAADAFGKPGTTYPVGSTIVKEKRALPYLSASQPQEWTTDHDGVGGMIKRSPGYDPEHGDWEYFYFEDPSAIESGRIVSCIECHGGAAARDFVFGRWAGPSRRP